MQTSSLFGSALGLIFATVYSRESAQVNNLLTSFVSPSLKKYISFPFVKILIQYFTFCFLGSVLGNMVYTGIVSFFPCLVVAVSSAGIESCLNYYDKKNAIYKETPLKET
jgi:hypothetical protein